MEVRKLIAADFIGQGYPKKLVLMVLDIPRSSYYYRPVLQPKSRGRGKSRYTRLEKGGYVPNSEVVKDIKYILNQEFVDYGYLKVTHYLRQEKGYIINPKKVYRVMGEHKLLNKHRPRDKGQRRWVKELLPPAKQAFDYLEFDIKYMYVAGLNRNALILSVIDVKTRWVLGQYMGWQINQKQVIGLFDQIFAKYPLPKHFYIRCDNGSQFIAQTVQQYFEQKGVTQEFCKPSTPEQNAHIESYHAIIEKVVCQRYEFIDLNEIRNTMNRFVKFYNFDRIHSGTDYTSPYKFLLGLGINMNPVKNSLALDCFSYQKAKPNKQLKNSKQRQKTAVV